MLGAFAPELVGALGLAREEPARFRHKARLWGLYVRPAWRGHGLGRRMLEEAARRARAAGVAQLTLRVAVPCRAAIRLYEREGFEVFGREPRALRDATGDQDELHMARRLDGPAR